MATNFVSIVTNITATCMWEKKKGKINDIVKLFQSVEIDDDKIRVNV